MNFWKANIDRAGRIQRAITGGCLVVAATLCAWLRLWPGVWALGGCGLFCLFEAARGWCFLRACGIKTKS